MFVVTRARVAFCAISTLTAFALAWTQVFAGEAPKGEPTNADEAALQKKYGDKQSHRG